MLPVSAAAYAKDAHAIETCLKNAIGNVTDVYQYSYPCQNGQCSGYVAKLPEYGAIIIGFRGTQTVNQLLQQGIDGIFKSWSRWDYGGNVLFYFHDVFHTLWGKIENHFYNYVHQQPGWDVWISGHSLGGALATLATSYLVEEYKLEPEKVKLVTFGQPRVGNRVFAERFDARNLYAYRLVHARDLVPGILKTGYWHQGGEVIDSSLSCFQL
ncbi:hypothetical protein Y032_0320g2412 [Ancylostoma ceylanicum]|nr:hypothetical protein Y032_0320g2412 [Ancylostoma ceylanicum]